MKTEHTFIETTLSKSKKIGELTHINLEHLFDDLFKLRDNFKELGMIIKDGEVCLPDLEEKNVEL